MCSHWSRSEAKLDCEEFSNYRPITNIAFLSKTIERAAAAQTLNYLTKNNLLAKFQSAYRQFHGMETALLRVCNDILQAIDEGQEVSPSASGLILRFRYNWPQSSARQTTHSVWFQWNCSRMVQIIPIKPYPVGKNRKRLVGREWGPIWSPARFRAGTSPVLFIFHPCWRRNKGPRFGLYDVRWRFTAVHCHQSPQWSFSLPV